MHTNVSCQLIARISFSLLIILYGLEDKERHKCSEVDQKTFDHMFIRDEMI